MKTFHTTSWPVYICAWAPANVFVCCSSTPSVVAVCPRVQKSVGSWVDGHDCQWTRLLPGAGLSARDIRQNSVAGHIFLCFLREARQVVPLGFSICIFSQMSFPLLYFSVSLLIQPFLSLQEPVSKHWKYSYLILIPSLELKNNNNKISRFSAQLVCLSNFI